MRNERCFFGYGGGVYVAYILHYEGAESVLTHSSYIDTLGDEDFRPIIDCYMGFIADIVSACGASWTDVYFYNDVF